MSSSRAPTGAVGISYAASPTQPATGASTPRDVLDARRASTVADAADDGIRSRFRRAGD
ncbi:hypothetical protein ACFCVY_32040 [Streptomyces sp. NPDC056411]|uniref:hypothetical protein n=1 Tax=Streptomyces sp. NPDC056411 TaxID=3345813 RepID=UPI0035DD4347